jgi:transposase
MERAELERYLDRGLSLAEIGELVGRDPTTVSYWLRKYGLKAVNHDRHAARGGLTKEQLEPLVARGSSLRAIASELEVSVATVRHWVRRYELTTRRMSRLEETREARATGRRSVRAHCKRHGLTDFRVSSGGGFRCAKCNSDAVSARRRRVKAILVEEAGGHCVICGYDRYPGALHFHHTEPGEKAFILSRRGHTRSLAEARDEARKCVLLCSNCHAEVEGGIVNLPEGCLETAKR